MEDLLLIDREQARQDAFGQASAENNNLGRVSIIKTNIIKGLHRIPHPWCRVCREERNEGLRAANHVIYSGY